MATANDRQFYNYLYVIHKSNKVGVLRSNLCVTVTTYDGSELKVEMSALVY